ncbi:MAG: DUF4835 family protein [Bacteroidales bacterium]|nr:DUF4835 family protein [Bacteroidales bacterium]
MRKITFVWMLMASFSLLQGQELKCNVQVVSQQIQGTNKQVFETLQNGIYEFMNNRVWTNHVYTVEERIECNMMFNITEQLSSDEFKGTLSVQARRPVYNTNYNTVMLNFIDNDIHFRYVEFSPLEFDLNSHYSNLTSILAFYAYFILGLDYDSFSMYGGTPFFENAEKIVENAQNAPEKGWKSMDNISHKNRYWLVKDFLDSEYQPVREFIYRYHRLGLDLMDEEVARGREEIANSLELLQEVYRSRPDNYMYTLRLLFDTKVDELVNMFRESYPEEKNRAYNLLVEIDQPNQDKYKAMQEAAE